MLSDEEEVLNLVDENDEVIGTITHAEAYDIMKTKRGFLRASNAFIINSEGKLWVPRRQPHKKIAPNGLDYSMGEHVRTNETYLEAAVRGFVEELNMQVSPEDLVPIGKLAPEPGQPPYFVYDYIYRSDAEPDYNKSDFESAEWLAPQELKERLQNGEAAKASLPFSMESLLRYQTDSQRNY